MGLKEINKTKIQSHVNYHEGNIRFLKERRTPNISA